MNYENWNPPKGQLEFVHLDNGVCRVMRCINGVPVENNQPERLSPEACNHCNTKPENRLSDDSWICEICNALISRSDSLNSMET